MKIDLMEKYQKQITEYDAVIDSIKIELKQDGLTMEDRADCRAEIRRFRSMKAQAVEFIRDIEAIKDNFHYEPIDRTNGKFWTNK